MIESQTQQHVPFRLEAKVIAVALQLACHHDAVRVAFPPESRAVLFDIAEKWQTISESSMPEGSE